MKRIMSDSGGIKAKTNTTWILPTELGAREFYRWLRLKIKSRRLSARKVVLFVGTITDEFGGTIRL